MPTKRTTLLRSFLESFCVYRRELSLPVAVLLTCPIENIGYVAERTSIKKLLKSQGLYFLSDNEALDYIELLLLNQCEAHVDEKGQLPVLKAEGNAMMGRDQKYASMIPCVRLNCDIILNWAYITIFATARFCIVMTTHQML